MGYWGVSTAGVRCGADAGGQSLIVGHIHSFSFYNLPTSLAYEYLGIEPKPYRAASLLKRTFGLTWQLKSLQYLAFYSCCFHIDFVKIIVVPNNLNKPSTRAENGTDNLRQEYSDVLPRF